MIADAASAGGLWPSVVVAVVLVLTLLAWAVDHARSRRRLAALERAEAFLTTDLGDARREVVALRDTLHHRVRADTDRPVEAAAAEPPAPLS